MRCWTAMLRPSPTPYTGDRWPAWNGFFFFLDASEHCQLPEAAFPKEPVSVIGLHYWCAGLHSLDNGRDVQSKRALLGCRPTPLLSQCRQEERKALRNHHHRSPVTQPSRRRKRVCPRRADDIQLSQRRAVGLLRARLRLDGGMSHRGSVAGVAARVSLRARGAGPVACARL